MSLSKRYINHPYLTPPYSLPNRNQLIFLKCTFKLNIIEVDTNIIIVPIPRHCLIHCGLVNPSRLRELPILLQIPRLVRRVLVQDVHLLVLEVALPHQHDVPRSHPYLLAHLASNVSEAGNAVVTEALASAVPEHPHDLGVFLSVLLEFEFALRFLAVSLSPPSILTPLSCGGADVLPSVAVTWAFGATNSRIGERQEEDGVGRAKARETERGGRERAITIRNAPLYANKLSHYRGGRRVLPPHTFGFRHCYR
jgi:hypothetical protein